MPVMVPAYSALYDHLESVSAFFPTRGVYLGERPLSVGELKRALARISSTVDSARVAPARIDWARRELAYVQAALDSATSADSVRRTVWDWSWRGRAVTTSAAATRFVPNGLGLIDAVTHPFGDVQAGWPITNGTASMAPAMMIASSQFAAVAEPLFSAIYEPNIVIPISRSLGTTLGSEPRRAVSVQRAYLAGRARNLIVTLGLDERRWGQSPLGSLFFSGNARPFPSLTIASDSTIVLPSLFRFAGPVRGVALLGDLGADQDPRHAKAVGWQVTIQPWTRFELGVAVLTQTAGEGAPTATVLQRIEDLLPVIDALDPRATDLTFSNKLAGGNLRIRFPELSGLDLYYELQLDDFDARRFRSTFVDDAGHLLGLRLPVLVGDGQISWRVEAQHTSIRLYEHAQFRSGVTYDHRLLGNPLGPNASAYFLSTKWEPSPRRSLELAFAADVRHQDHYHSESDDRLDHGFRFVLDAAVPALRRNRLLISADQRIGGGSVGVTLGANRAWRSGSEPTTSWMAQISFRSRAINTF